MNKTEFGKYTLLERISHGGMAEVFRAKTMGAAGFERTVALKVLLPQIASQEDVIAMLVDEAKIAGQLSHANIAQTFDLGQVEGRYFIVQEFIDGLDLRRLVAKLKRRGGGALEMAHACHIVLRVCEGLDYAHNKRDLRGVPLEIVHRDISPQNVIVSYEGEVKLVDFGIARAEGRVTRTLAGLVKGKFAYMSPEQIRGLPTDRRSDVFACGILLHELLSGRPLFLRDSDYETLERSRTAVIEPPSAHDPSIPPELDRITLKALARHVDDRYPSALAMRDDLWAFVQQHGCHCSRTELGAWMRDAVDESNTVPSAMAPDVAELSQITDASYPGESTGAADLDTDTLTGGTITGAGGLGSGTMVDGGLVGRMLGRTRREEHDTRTGVDAAASGTAVDTAVGELPPHRLPAFLDVETTSERRTSARPPDVRVERPEDRSGSQRRLALSARPLGAPAASPASPTATTTTMAAGSAPGATPPTGGSPRATLRGRAPSIASRAPSSTRDPDRSSPYLAYMDPAARPDGAMVPREAPDREDVPTSLQLLRSGAALPAAPAPARRGNRVLAGLVVVFLIGVAVAATLVLWRNAAPAPAAPAAQPAP